MGLVHGSPETSLLIRGSYELSDIYLDVFGLYSVLGSVKDLGTEQDKVCILVQSCVILCKELTLYYEVPFATGIAE